MPSGCPGARHTFLEAQQKANDLKQKFGLAETQWTSEVQAVLDACKCTFVTGITLYAFRQASDKVDLRKRLVKALATFPDCKDPPTVVPCNIGNSCEGGAEI